MNKKTIRKILKHNENYVIKTDKDIGGEYIRLYNGQIVKKKNLKNEHISKSKEDKKNQNKMSLKEQINEVKDASKRNDTDRKNRRNENPRVNHGGK